MDFFFLPFCPAVPFGDDDEGQLLFFGIAWSPLRACSTWSDAAESLESSHESVIGSVKWSGWGKKPPRVLFLKSDTLHQVDRQLSRMCSGNARPTGSKQLAFHSSKAWVSCMICKHVLLRKALYIFPGRYVDRTVKFDFEFLLEC